MSDNGTKKHRGTGLSRRDFLRISGLSLTAPVLSGSRIVKAAGSQITVYGPGKVPMTFKINGKTYTADLEPRVTLLDALRNEFDLTGAKRSCDRGTCGACSVIMDSKPVYACSILAIDAQGKQITTVESVADGKSLHPLQQAFIDNDAQQCGFCTPGFVVAAKAILDGNSNPTPKEVEKGLGGNLCRCGSYVGLKTAVLKAAEG